MNQQVNKLYIQEIIFIVVNRNLFGLMIVDRNFEIGLSKSKVNLEIQKLQQQHIQI
tara:strand:+ start:814 stop:981 length:168 start_codon:yes stop_codon:yes gene_type:complete